MSRSNIYSRSYHTFKRLFDIAGSLLLLALLLPLMILVALLIVSEKWGPIIYRQRRLTEGGRVFTIYKFRTMSLDAESRSGPVWAEKTDSRVTSLGKLLRRSRLDELPQLVNVLIGDMSLIGPRPERPELAAELTRALPDFDQRLGVKAGITGLAQVSSGYANCMESYKTKLKYDLDYVANHSVMLDFRIALKTVSVVLNGNGAH